MIALKATAHTNLEAVPRESETLASYILRRVRAFQRRLQRAGIDHMLVAERHKSGRWHLHMAVRGFIPFDTVYMLWSPDGYEAWKEDRHEARDIVFASSGPRGKQLALHAIASYMTKYITKDALAEERQGHHLYWQSRGIKAPGHIDGWTGSLQDMLSELLRRTTRRTDGMPGTIDYFYERKEIQTCGMSPPR